MHFDPENRIVKRCASGMQLEGEGKPAAAAELFQQAWAEASSGMEKFIAAHYMARHQATITGKLEWDKIALEQALAIDTEDIKSVYPSLYLNIARCYEDMNDFGKARENYQLAFSFVPFLPDDGYGKMISSGIYQGIERVQQ